MTELQPQCTACNKPLSPGDFCDDLQCPNPAASRDAAEGAEESKSLFHSLPTDGAVDSCLVCGINNNSPFPCVNHSAPPKPAPDAMREALKLIERTCNVRAASIARDALRVDESAAISAPVPPADGATGIEAAKLIEDYIRIRDSLDEDDCANIVHILHEAGVQFGSPSPAVAAEPDRNTLAFWRNDALEKAALIVMQWKADPAIAFDIRALKSDDATPPVRGDRDIIRDFEDVCEKIAATRPQAAYLAMIDGGQGNLLAELDEIRHRARAILSLSVQPGAGEREACIACNAALESGDLVYNDESGGFIHAACCGPERESYVANGEPLKAGNPIPAPWAWHPGKRFPVSPQAPHSSREGGR